MTDMNADAKLGDEAAFWFARMRRPDKERYREAFELWLGTDDNLRAYNRIAAHFADAKILRQSAVTKRPNTSKNRRHLLLVLGMISLCLASPWVVTGSLPGTGTIGRKTDNRISYTNARNEPIPVKLADGSTVVLDAKGRFETELTLTERLITLTNGRARFTVAHGTRPFRVVAANTKVTAHGTVFDVAIMRRGQVRVALFSGIIEIETPSRANGDKANPPLIMKPGDVIEYRRNAAEIIALPSVAAQIGWPDGILDFETVTLGELVAQANRHSNSKIVLADPANGKLTLSGRFSIRNSERLADHSARIFGLRVDRSQRGLLVLRSH